MRSCALSTPSMKSATDAGPALASMQRCIRRALTLHRDNWAAAARSLGLHRSNLHHLAKRLGLR